MVESRLPAFGILLLVVSAGVLSPLPARGDVVDDHPNWFNFTSGPELDGHMAASSEPATELYVRLMPTLASYQALLDGLDPAVNIRVLHAGASEKAAGEGMLGIAGIGSERVSWYDLEIINSYAVGDWGFVQVAALGGPVMVDFKFDPGKPYDDSAPTRLAKILGTCVHRPPLLMQRGHVESNGQGMCLVSSRLSSLNPGLSKGQLDVLLTRTLGCEQLVVLQPLQGENRGRIDILARFGPQGRVLMGVHEVSQDPGNRLIELANVKAVEETCGDLCDVVQVPMPSPRLDLVGDSAWPSYLSFVVTPSTVLVPVFSTLSVPDPSQETMRQNGFVTAMESAFPEHDIQQVSADMFLAAGLRLNSVLLPASQPFTTTCNKPTDICSANIIESCSVCFDECLYAQYLCKSQTEVGLCDIGDNGCFSIETEKCDDNWTCIDGACKPPVSVCDDMPKEGRCDDDILQKCAGSTLIEVDCSESNSYCGYSLETGEPQCLAFCEGACGTLGETQCDEADLLVCELGNNGCPAWTRQTCSSGQCQEGACVPDSGDITSDASNDSWSDMASSEDGGMNAGFRRTGGCGMCQQPVSGFAVFGLVLAALLLLVAERMKKRHPGN